MSDKLKKLMDDNIKKQQDLKKSEMQALQAQITPHFLYNTFDTIVWLAEEEKYQEVISVTRAFAGFFRISLSKGSDWITVSQELVHAKHYLTIQQVRYRDILEYELFEDKSIENESMLKLLLQPLIENALYHGLKNKRGRGKISVTCKKLERGMSFEVFDTGIGMDHDKLIELKKTLEMPAPENHKGYGLYNVNQRLRLYYGKEYELHIESEKGLGTKVSFSIPFIK